MIRITIERSTSSKPKQKFLLDAAKAGLEPSKWSKLRAKMTAQVVETLKSTASKLEQKGN